MLLDRIFLFIIIALTVTSCGYRWHYDYPEGSRPTVTVPLIKDDEDASLTSEIITSLNASGVVKVVPRNGDYCLQVNILSRQNEKIGFRRDPQKIQGKVTTNLIASE